MKANRLTLVTLLSLLFLSSTHVVAQVTIGDDVAPKQYSILELSTENIKGGLRLPQLSTSQRDALILDGFADGLIIYNTDENCVNYYNGIRWRSFCEGAGWFYMPSIVISVTTSGTFQRDLYLEYKKQFADTDDELTPENSPTPGTALVKSDANAPNPLTRIYAAGELYYYVTGYDTTVFSNLSVTSNGVLSYTVNADNVTEATYMNIVFVVK